MVFKPATSVSILMFVWVKWPSWSAVCEKTPQKPDRTPCAEDKTKKENTEQTLNKRELLLQLHFDLNKRKKRLSGGVCDVYKPFPWSQFGSLKAACRALLSEITKSYFDILNFLITNCLHTETNENCISHWKTENVLESIK